MWPLNIEFFISIDLENGRSQKWTICRVVHLIFSPTSMTKQALFLKELRKINI